MKINREEFTPITITIETQDELDYLLEASASVYGEGKVRDFFDEIYTRLSDFGAKSQDQLSGTLKVKE